MKNVHISVLAIEDSPDDAELLRHMLGKVREPSFTFAQAPRLSEGLQLLRDKGGSFDIVLLDLKLPDSEGMDSVLEIRRQSPTIPIIVFTGLDDDEVAFKALHLDVQDYLTKGQIDRNLLVRSIRYAIERKRAVEALRNSEARFRRLSESGIIGIVYFNGAGRIIDGNDKFLEMIGATREDLAAGRLRRWVRLVPPEWQTRTREASEEFRTTGRITPYETEYLSHDGSKHWGLFGAAKLDGQTNEIAFIVDITERKKLEVEITHMAHHDVLTGLPNRRLFMELIRLKTAEARRNRTKAGLLFLDLDRFKEVNDTLGHEAGDELLKVAAERLRASIRDSDAVARIGGDEFSILLAGITRPEDISDIARKILDAFREKCIIAGHEFTITASMGISVYPDDSETIESLFRYADIALYHAKTLGRNMFEFYDPDISRRSIERLKFENALRRTVTGRELTVHYQPQIDIGTGRIVSAEALVRWKHPELGLLDAKRFIPTAESIGIITDIDEWVLRTSCLQLKSWLDAGYAPLFIATNLSSRVFQKPGFADTITRIIDETGVPPHFVDIEITESAAVVDIEGTIDRLHELSEKGIRITIDDFGTGYASLNNLKRLPFQRLKIDQTFVKDIATDSDDRAIVGAVTAMAHQMKISVVAEGVETAAQLSCLTATRCDEAQGYFFNRAMPPGEFAALMSGCTHRNEPDAQKFTSSYS
jgi:diguanylate cyclase (GGDEF)-like protein/PAS domain S-box-containing protein